MPNTPVPAAGIALPADPLAAAFQRFDDVFARIDALHDRGDMEALRFQHARQRMEASIERLIALLDAVDPDAEAEPMLGWTHDEARRGEYVPDADEREYDDDFELDDAERGIGDKDALYEIYAEYGLMTGRHRFDLAGDAQGFAASEMARFEATITRLRQAAGNAR